MKKIYQIRFLPEGITVAAREGITLREAAQSIGIFVDSPCAGRGICGKCLAQIQDRKGERRALACQTKVDQDMTVRFVRKEDQARILKEGTKREVSPDSGIRLIDLELSPIRAGEAEGIWERVRSGLAQKTGEPEDAFTVSWKAAGTFYRILKENDWKVWAVLAGNRLMELSGEKPDPYLMAVDIGTTTVAAYLMDQKGLMRAKVSRMNPQTAFGADVISRADYAAAHGTAPLSKAVREAVAELAEEAAAVAGIRRDQIYLICLAGNTCMHHLFLDIQPEALVKAPYSPVIREAVELSAQEIPVGIHPYGQIRMLPNLAGFVGADTSACLLAAEADRWEDETLLLDIGTNGEMVLGTREETFACSTAAGPAFEGARIACGMRGAEGAIDHVWMEAGELRYSVIGGKTPMGICGSGLLDAAAVLLQNGWMDSFGEFQQIPETAACRMRVIEQEGNRILVFLDEDGRDTGVYLTRKDMGELQLAKAAIAAGIRILCGKRNIHPQQIRRILLAGAFGSYMNPESACRIGMLPDIDPEKIVSVGNAAGEGARIAALNRKEWERCSRMAAGVKFVELAAEASFSDLFVEALEYPEGQEE